MTEFSGGPPQIGKDYDDEGRPSRVLTVMPDLSAMDSVVDQLRECIAEGRDVTQFFLDAAMPEIRKMQADAINRLLDLISRNGNPGLAIDQISWVSGRSMCAGETLGTLARKWGISKEAFAQGSKEFRDVFAVRSQSERTDHAKEKMREAHYSRPSIPKSYLAAQVPSNTNRGNIRRRNKPRRVGRHRKKGHPSK